MRRSAAARKPYAGVKWLTEEQLFNTPGLRALAVETEVKDLLAEIKDLQIRIEEKEKALAHVKARADKRKAWEDVLWALARQFGHPAGWRGLLFCFGPSRHEKEPML